MHDANEDSGEPSLFVHGSAAWSFAYRHLIHALRQDYCCVAPDHIGFGMSAKPAGEGDEYDVRVYGDTALVSGRWAARGVNRSEAIDAPPIRTP